MSTIFFISDLHFGHKNIWKFEGPSRGNAQSMEEAEEWLIEQWNSVVSKRDQVYVLGDAAFNKVALAQIKRLRGNKILLMGNHDVSINSCLQVFGSTIPFCKKFGYWLSHPPIHPTELRGRKNIHGHVHSNSLPDDMYINVCVEVLGGKPVSLDEINSIHKAKGGSDE